jgi:microcystin-dependent protein
MNPFIGEVRAVGFNFGPEGWNICQGQLISISDNQALFTLIGTTYGGDGMSTFGLPNLQSRVPVHQGNLQGTPYLIGQLAGVETVTINASTFPTHQHAFVASSAATGATNSPGSNTMANGVKIYKTANPTAAMSTAMVSFSNGGNQPHSNIQPYQAINWIIALSGVFPSQ